MDIILFVLGAASGSFLGVVADRYDPERSLFDLKRLGGRSRCASCKKILGAGELIPLVSFVLQGGRCRGCRTPIPLWCPFVEIVAGLLFVFVPKSLGAHLLSFFSPLGTAAFAVLAALWILVFLFLLLISLIDLRLRIIPDELNVLLVAAGILVIALTAGGFGLTSGSFVGSYAALFGLRGNIWGNHAAGLLFGLFFFGSLVILTRGRGMGMGDVKLAASLGAVFGWPDIVFLVVLAFVVGSVVGFVQIVFRGKGLKSLLPFGPFLALGAGLIFFFGYDILGAYFKLFPLP